ncbi:flavodoxin family protein [Candidatus Bathyarchaeota archaeon]|nr:MAG: flavodoxin family protein [Candidatus Bathyarchaeota archaeon]
MKALGVVGSPNKDGNTAYLLKYMFKKLSCKLETEIIYLKDLEIKPCDGCWCCESDGECIIEDDMKMLYPKLLMTDVIVLSSPSYMGGVTSRLRAFMERTWHLRKGQLSNKIGTYIVVGRRKICSAVIEMEEYLERMRMIKITGVVGYAFKKGEIKKDKEAFRDADKTVEQILRVISKRGVPDSYRGCWPKNLKK